MDHIVVTNTPLLLRAPRSALSHDLSVFAQARARSRDYDALGVNTSLSG